MDENLVPVARDQILHRVRGEYLEMPGLRLTFAQARRLWGLDEQTCAQLLQALTEQEFLRCGPDGTYARLTVRACDFPAARMITAGQAPAPPAPPVPPTVAATSWPMNKQGSRLGTSPG